MGPKGKAVKTWAEVKEPPGKVYAPKNIIIFSFPQKWEGFNEEQEFFFELNRR